MANLRYLDLTAWARTPVFLLGKELLFISQQSWRTGRNKRMEITESSYGSRAADVTLEVP